MRRLTVIMIAGLGLAVAPTRAQDSAFATGVSRTSKMPTAAMVGFMTRANSVGLATFTARHGR